VETRQSDIPVQSWQLGMVSVVITIDAGRGTTAQLPLQYNTPCDIKNEPLYFFRLQPLYFLIDFLVLVRVETGINTLQLFIICLLEDIMTVDWLVA